LSIKHKIANTTSVPGLLMALVASVVTIQICTAEVTQPRLLVGIVVDGLDADYLDLLRERFGEGGFRRLEREAAFIPSADFGPGLDATAATATIMTGAAPSVSGIGSNTRYDRVQLLETGVFSDPSILGNFTSAGYSPSALRVTTIADESRMASGGVNMAYAVASDPCQAIAMAGHTSNSALWLDAKTGNWASSTFYKEMPVAIATRNRTVPLLTRLDTMSWTPLLDPSLYPALPDHLRRYPFRYVFPRGSADRLKMLAASPMGNSEVTSVASGLISGMKLGTHPDGTDVLNIAYSLRPYEYAKSSDTRVELMDAYLRLDRNLEQLFNEIDRSVGLDKTVLFLAATPPSSRTRREDERWGIPHGEFSTRKAISLLNMYLMAVYGNGDYVSAYHRGHFFLNNKLLKEKSLDESEVRRNAAAFLSKMTGVDRVFTVDEVIAGHAGEQPEALRRNTVVATAGDLIINVAPGFEIVDDFNTQVKDERTHHVERVVATTAPLFILAPEIVPQTVGEIVDARAIAPTICRILRIRSPNGASAAPLHLLRK